MILNDEVVIVSGVGAGLGAKLAARAAAEGAKVVLAARSSEVTDQTVKEIIAAGGEAIPPAWTEQLAIGGRLVAPLQDASGAQALVVIDRTPQGIRQTLLEAVHFVPLKSGVG